MRNTTTEGLVPSHIHAQQGKTKTNDSNLRQTGAIHVAHVRTRASQWTLLTLDIILASSVPNGKYRDHDDREWRHEDRDRHLHTDLLEYK